MQGLNEEKNAGLERRNAVVEREMRCVKLCARSNPAFLSSSAAAVQRQCSSSAVAVQQQCSGSAAAVR